MLQFLILQLTCVKLVHIKFQSPTEAAGFSELQSLQLSNNDKDQPKNIVTPVTPDINSLSIVLEAVEGVQGIHTTR